MIIFARGLPFPPCSSLLGRLDSHSSEQQSNTQNRNSITRQSIQALTNNSLDTTRILHSHYPHSLLSPVTNIVTSTTTNATTQSLVKVQMTFPSTHRHHRNYQPQSPLTSPPHAGAPINHQHRASQISPNTRAFTRPGLPPYHSADDRRAGKQDRTAGVFNPSWAGRQAGRQAGRPRIHHPNRCQYHPCHYTTETRRRSTRKRKEAITALRGMSKRLKAM